MTGTANLTTAATGSGGKSNFKHETTTSSLGVSKTVTHSTIAPGTVETQHVSVLLDHLFVDPPIVPFHVREGHGVGSDHRPIIVDLAAVR